MCNSSCQISIGPSPSSHDVGYQVFEENGRAVEVRSYVVSHSGRTSTYPDRVPEELLELRAEHSDGEWTVVDASGARWRRDIDHPHRPASAAHALALAHYRPTEGQWTD